MKQILNRLLAFALILISVNVPAQTLQEFINTALEKNYGIRIVRNEERIAANNNTLGNAGFLPSVGINGSVASSFTNLRQGFADGSERSGNNALNVNGSAQAMIDWTLFDGFRVRTTRKQLGLLEDLGRIDARFYVEQTVADIVIAYHELIYQQQMLDNYRQSLQISAYRLQLERKRKEVGAGKGIDHSQALVDHRTDSIRYLAQQQVVTALKLELNRLLNNDLEQPMEPTDTAFTAMSVPERESLLTSMAQNNHQLEQERLNELIAETDLRMAQADRYPTIGLFAGYEYNESFSQVGFFKTNRSFGPTFGARISFNLYDGGRTSLAIRNSRVYAENATLSKEEVGLNLKAEVFKLHSEYRSIMERISLAEANVQENEKVYRTAKEQLQRGSINGYDFRLTQLSLLEGRLALTELRYRLKAVEVSLQRLAGNVTGTYL